MVTPVNRMPVKINYGSPSEGPAAVPFNVDFTAQTIYSLDLSTLFDKRFMSAVLTVFVDNSSNSQPLYITIPDTGQRLVWQAQSQGYLPVMQGVSLKFIVQTT